MPPQGFSLDNNPPRHKAGGLTTIYEKSLGRAKEAAPRRLYEYAERIAGLVSWIRPATRSPSPGR
jgi:altronate dehydratase